MSLTTWLTFTGVHAPVLYFVFGLLGSLAPVHWCPRSACCVVCVVSLPTSLPFISVHAPCVRLRVRCPPPLGCRSLMCTLVVLCVRCPWPLGSCSELCTLICCTVWSVSLALWLLFIGVPAPFVVLCLRCPWPLHSCSPVCTLAVLCCVCGVLGHLAPAHRCARSFVVLSVPCPWLLGSCSLLSLLGLVCWPCGVLRHFAPVHRCARSLCCVACAVSLATWLLFTGLRPGCDVCAVCLWPLGSRSPLCRLGVLWFAFGFLGHLALVQRCARLVCFVACVVFLAAWVPFTGVHARCVVCAVSFDTWLPFIAVQARCAVCGVYPATRCLLTGVHAECVVLCVRFPWPFGSCSTVCTLHVLCCLCGFLGHLAPVHCCAKSMCCVVSAVSLASWLPLTRVHARFVVLRLRCLCPLGSCSPVCTLGVLCSICGVLGLLAPVHRCPRLVCCVAPAVPWPLGCRSLMCTRGALCLRCPWPLCSCSPVPTLDVLCCALDVLGHLLPVHRCARSVCCFVPAVFLATWLPLTGVHARSIVLCLWCPGPLGSRSALCTLFVLCCMCGVLGHLVPAYGCARSVYFVAFAVSLATLLPFTAVRACCVVCVVSLATRRSFTRVHVWCVVCPCLLALYVSCLFWSWLHV